MSRPGAGPLRLLRSPRLMLVVFLALLAAPVWATSLAVAAAAAIAAVGAVRSLAQRWRSGRGESRDGIELGVATDGRRVMVTDRELSAHGLILGASGSGKTTALLRMLEQQIARGAPVVAIDMKGSPTFAAHLARAAAEAGRPFKLWTPDGPGFWNPLQHGNATEGKDKLISTERFTEPHYQRAAERYMQTVLQVLHHLHPERAPTLEEVVGLMDPNRLPARLREVPQSLADRVQDYLNELGADQRSAIRGLRTRLAIITEASAGEYLSSRGEPTIDLRAALDGGDVVLFSLNSSRYGQFAAQLGTLAVQDLICATGMRLEDGSGPTLAPATVAIDEFSGIGGEHVVALFARGREAGVRVLVATQEMADLDRAGRGVRDQVLGSTSIKLILRQDVPESAHTVAQIAGTERIWEETRQIGGGTLFSPPGARGTQREVERFIVHPNEVKSLQTGEAVLISKLRGGRARLIRVQAPPGSERVRSSSYVKEQRSRSASGRGRGADPGGYADPGVMR